jgi:hypothetical protein
MRISNRKTVNPFPDPPVPDVDGAGLMVPPWVKFPNLPLGSMGWRMGMGEIYWGRFVDWYRSQPADVRREVAEKYLEDEDWSDFYRRSGSPS